MAEIGCCTKYFLFFFNVLFWIIGLLLLGIGIWAWSEKGYIDSISVISALPIDPVFIIIIVAIVMFVLSFAGCLGSLRENICLLKVFSIGLGIIFFAELIAGVLGFIYKDWFRDQFATFLQTTIMQYRNDPDLQNIIDFSQEYLQCCGGAGGPDDWNDNVYFNCSSRIQVNGIFYTPREACGVPFSCCVRDNTQVVNTQCGFGVRLLDPIQQTDRIHTNGCIIMFEDWLKVNLYTVAGVLIGVALIQIIPICFAQNLTNDIQAVQARWLTEESNADFGLRFTSIAQIPSDLRSDRGFDQRHKSVASKKTSVSRPSHKTVASKKTSTSRPNQYQSDSRIDSRNRLPKDGKSLKQFTNINPEETELRKQQTNVIEIDFTTYSPRELRKDSGSLTRLSDIDLEEKELGKQQSNQMKSDYATDSPLKLPTDDGPLTRLSDIDLEEKELGKLQPIQMKSDYATDSPLKLPTDDGPLTRLSDIDLEEKESPKLQPNRMESGSTADSLFKLPKENRSLTQVSSTYLEGKEMQKQSSISF